MPTTYREMLKQAGITEEQVAQAMGYRSAHNMRTSNRCERTREAALNFYNLIEAARNTATTHDVAPQSTIPPNPCVFLTFYREAATDKIAAATNTPGTPHPGTDDPNFAVWAFYLYKDKPQAVNMPRKFLGTKWVECENPCNYPSGAKLWEAMQPWHSWHVFMEQVNIENKYDGVFQFFLEYPAEVIEALYQPEGKLPVPFASTRRVFAIFGPETTGDKFWLKGITSIYSDPSKILNTSSQKDYIVNYTRQIDEKTARVVHPELFAHLDSLTPEQISSKKDRDFPTE